MAETLLSVTIRAIDKATPELKKLATAVKQAKKDIEALNSAAKSGAAGKNIGKAADESKKLADNSKKAAVQAKGVDRAVAPISAKFAKATVSAQAMAQSISQSRGQLLATAAAAGAVVLGFRNAAQAFFAVELAVAEVGTLIDDAVLSNEELLATVIELSNEYGVGATEVARGLYQAISAGAEAGAEANELLNTALQLSIAGLTDTETAVDGLTSIINAFGKDMSDAADVSDILFQTVKNGKTTVEELSQRFFQIGPIAAAVGISLNDITAATVALTKQGTKTRIAFTQIRAAIAGLSRENPQVVDAFNQIGFESFQAAIQAQGLGKTLNDIATLAERDVGAIQKLTGSIEGAQGIMQATAQDAVFFNAALADLENRSGALANAFREIDSTRAKNFEQAITRLSNVVVQIGKIVEPALATVVETLAAFSERITEIIQSMGSFGRFLAGIGGVVALVTAGVTLLIVAVGFLIVAFNLVGPIVISNVSAFFRLATATDAVTARFIRLGGAAAKTKVRLASLTRSAIGITTFIILADVITQAALAFNKLQVDIEVALNTMSAFNVEVNQLENRVGGLDLSKVDFTDLTKLESKAPEELDAITSEIETRLKVFEKQLKVLAPVLKAATEDSLEGVRQVASEIFPQIGREFKNLLGTDLGFGTKDPEPPQIIGAFAEIEDAILQLKTQQRITKIATRELDRKRALSPLKITFAELTNSVKAASKAFLSFDDIKLSKIKNEINALSQNEIDLALDEGDIVKAETIRAEAQNQVQAREEEFAARRADLIKAEVAARKELVEGEFRDTIEQRRKKQDQLNKLERELTFFEIKELRKRSSSLSSNLNERLKLATNFNKQLRKLTEDEAEVERSLQDNLTSIRRAEAAERGQEEAFIRSDALRKLRQFQSLIRSSDTAKEFDDNKAAIDATASALQGLIGEVTSAGEFNLAKILSRGLATGQRDLVARQRERVESALDIVNAQIESVEKRLADVQKELDASPLIIRTVIDLTDEGLDSIKKKANKNARAALEGVVAAAAAIKPSINGEQIEADLQKIIDLSVEAKEALELGFAPRIPRSDVEVVTNKLEALADKSKEAQDNFKVIATEIAKVAKALDNVDKKNFFSDISKEQLQSQDVLKNRTGEEVGTALTAVFKGVATQFQKDLLVAVEAITKLDLGLGIGQIGPLQADGSFSGGGHVSGPGTSTSDSITARLSNNEFVMQARAVSHFGRNFMDSVNNMSFNALPKFAGGGLVQTRIPTPATSGENTRDVVDLNFNIGGQSIKLQGRRDQVALLTRATRQLQSTLIGG